MSLKNPVVYVDIETTGLDKTKDIILELAAIHVDFQTLDTLDTFQRIVHVPHIDELIEHNPWVRKTHSESGLIDLVKRPPLADHVCGSIEELDRDFSAWLKQIGVQPTREGSAYLAGNSIAQFDKVFIERDMPLTTALLSYRVVEIRTLLTCMEEWFGCKREVEVKHRALEDCHMSLSATRWARALCKGSH